MNPGAISVISLEEVDYDEEKERNAKIHSKSMQKNLLKAICISLFGIIAVSIIFAVPWTSIPRTDSIIYQSHWLDTNHLSDLYRNGVLRPKCPSLLKHWK